MRVISIVGHSGSGKTRLVTRLVRHFARAGVRVGTVKHASHGFDVPGKDSHAHFTAGAEVTILAGGTEFAVFRRGAAPLRRLVRQFRGLHLVIVEGYREERLPRIEVWRRAVASRPMGGRVDAIVTDDPIDAGVPVFGTRQIARIAQFIERNSKRQ